MHGIDGGGVCRWIAIRGGICLIVNTAAVQVYSSEIADTCKEARREAVVEARVLILINIEARLICGHSCLEFPARRSAGLVRIATGSAAVQRLHDVVVSRAISHARIGILGCAHA